MNRRELLKLGGALTLPPGAALAYDLVASDRTSTAGSGPSSQHSTPEELTPFDATKSLFTEEERRTIERTTFKEMNKRREDDGDPTTDALSYNPTLAAIARNYSREMGQEAFFSHTHPETGTTWMERLKRYDYEYFDATELIASVGEADDLTPAEVAETFVQIWMNSELHRKAILNGRFHLTGVGVYISEGHAAYATAYLVDRY